MMCYKKIFFVASLLIFMSCIAQKQHDKYLDSLAKGIQFKYKDTILTKESYKEVEKIAFYLKGNNKSYNIESHTCSVGSSKDNIPMTEKRAKIVKRLLVHHGIKAKRFFAIGYGEDFPVRTCYRETRYLNRRIAFVEVIEDKTEINK